MKTLKESILDKDFDIKDINTNFPKAKELVEILSKCDWKKREDKKNNLTIITCQDFSRELWESLDKYFTERVKTHKSGDDMSMFFTGSVYRPSGFHFEIVHERYDDGSRLSTNYWIGRKWFNLLSISTSTRKMGFNATEDADGYVPKGIAEIFNYFMDITK